MRKFICSILSAVLILVNISCASAGMILSDRECEKYLDEISRYEMSVIQNPSYGSVGGEWMIMGLARYGTATEEYISKYRNNLEKHLNTCNGVLSKTKYTDYARVVLALTAIEENPESFAGYNLLKPLAELDNVISKGANGIIYALIAFDSGNYEIPEPKEGYDGRKTTREKLVSLILENQKEDGGWSLAGTKSDTDVTAMAVQALAPYYTKDNKVKKAVEQGLDRLSGLQQNDGGYKSVGRETCESNAQVLTALSVMNIDIKDKRFMKNGNTVFDGLMKYYKGGAFSHFPNGDANQIATEQALYALTAYYRSISGMNSLYEMNDGITRRTLKSEENKKVQNAGIEIGSEKRHSKKKAEANLKNKKAAVEKKEKVTSSKTMAVETESKSENIRTDTSKKKKQEQISQKKSAENEKEAETSTDIRTKNVSDKKEKEDSTASAIAFTVLILAAVGTTGFIIYKKRIR